MYWRREINILSEIELKKLFPFLENAVQFKRYWLPSFAKDGSKRIRIRYQLDDYSPVEYMDFSSAFLEKQYKEMMNTNINSTS